MPLKDTIKASLNEAIKSKNKTKTSTLRLVLSAIKDKEISNKQNVDANQLDDPDILDILSKMRQQRLESLKIFEQAGRVDLVATEQNELNIITDFMPKQLDDDDIRKICVQFIDELEASGLKDMGRIMEKLKSNYGYRVDFGRAGSIAKELLQAKNHNAIS